MFRENSEQTAVPYSRSDSYTVNQHLLYVFLSYAFLYIYIFFFLVTLTRF